MKKTTKIILIGGAGVGLATVAIIASSKRNNVVTDDKSNNENNKGKDKTPIIPPKDLERKLACKQGDGFTCMVDIFAPEFVKFREIGNKQFEVLTRTYKNYKTKQGGFNDKTYVLGKNGKYAKVSFSYTERLTNKRVNLDFRYNKKRLKHTITITLNGKLYKEIKL